MKLYSYLSYTGLLLAVKGQAKADSPFNNPPGVDIWCGKAYRDTNSSFDPGGQLFPPTNNTPPNSPRLSLKVYPRYNYYLTSDKTASLIVDTAITYVGNQGSPWYNLTYDPDATPLSPTPTPVPFTELKLNVYNGLRSQQLVNWTRVPVNRMGTELDVSLESLQGKEGTWDFQVVGASLDGIQTFYAQMKIVILAKQEPDFTGSIARLDRLHGGIQTRSSITKGRWKSVFPFSFYVSWDWIQSGYNVTEGPRFQNIIDFHARGYNLIHPVPPGGPVPFDAEVFSAFLSICDSLPLYVMYDMRHTYQNASSVTAQLALLSQHPSLLLYYTADEPDGPGDPLNATALAYDHIRSLDPYHPVSLVLNCQNFYFDEYTSGADIVLEDAYTFVKSSFFSPVYNTACNATYGDCGCDNCHANDPAYPEYVSNPYRDISDRVDTLYQYQDWLGQAPTKPIWGVSQGFYDADSFWSRFLTGKEFAVSSLLRVVHGVKGVVSWIYPTNEDIDATASALAKVMTTREVTELLLNTQSRPLRVSIGGKGSDRFDAAAWVGRKEMLVILVHTGVETLSSQTIMMGLPRDVRKVEALYGFDGWTALANQSRELKASGIKVADVSILWLT